MKSVNMEKLNMQLSGSTIRYKNYVLFIKKTADRFQWEIYQPIETEEETGLDFSELRLEQWHSSTEGYPTEGEAILAAIQCCAI